MDRGRYSAIKAKQVWDDWAATKDHLRDSLGPDGLLQPYVRTDIEIFEDDVYTKGKDVRRGGKQLKDTTDEHLTKLRRRIQTGLDEVGEELCFVFAFPANPGPSPSPHHTSCPQCRRRQLTKSTVCRQI